MYGYTDALINQYYVLEMAIKYEKLWYKCGPLVCTFRTGLVFNATRFKIEGVFLWPCIRALRLLLSFNAVIIFHASSANLSLHLTSR